MKLNKTLTALALAGTLSLAGCNPDHLAYSIEGARKLLGCDTNTNYYVVDRSILPESKYFRINQITSPARDSVPGQRKGAYWVLTEKELIAIGQNPKNYSANSLKETAKIMNGDETK